MAAEKKRAEAKPEEEAGAADAETVTVTYQFEYIHSSWAIRGPGRPARPSSGGEGKGGGEGRGARDRIGPHPLKLGTSSRLRRDCDGPGAGPVTLGSESPAAGPRSLGEHLGIDAASLIRRCQLEVTDVAPQFHHSDLSRTWSSIPL